MRLRAAVAILAAVASLGLALFWVASRDGGRRPEQLSLAQLAFGQEDYSGRLVHVAGVVQRFGPEDGALRLHYVIADTADNRVRLIGGDPARYLGQVVDVTGRFRFSETAGRTIDVETIGPAGAPASG